MKKAADTVLCILPFEPPLYEEIGVNAVFVGHPKASEAPDTVDSAAARNQLGLRANQVIAVMPGSRTGEVQRIGPVFAQAVRQLADRDDALEFVVPIAHPKLKPLLEEQLAAASVTDGRQAGRRRFPGGYERSRCRPAGIRNCGARSRPVLRKPGVAAYRLAPLTYFLARKVFRIKLTHVTLPNLLTEEPLIPEFLQHDAQPDPIADAVMLPC